MFYTYLQKKALRFRRLTRCGYAAFASMHKEVSIGRLARRLCDMELLKAGKSIAVCSIALACPSVWADDPVPPDPDAAAALLNLNEVQVTATAQLSSTARPVTVINHQEFSSLTIRSVADVIRQVTGLDVRRRGPSGVQADISLKGCTADQTVVMLNGINVTDVQTGHYSLDLPLTGDEIERVEVYASTATGLGAYAGVINIVTRRAQDGRTSVNGSLKDGEYGLFAPSASVFHHKGLLRSETTAGYNQSTGFTANTDYKIASAFTHFSYKGLEWQAGAQYKDAGANAFYALAYPEQFDATRTAFTSAALHKQLAPHWLMDADLSYRAHFDRFELFREGTETPAWYTGHNRHWTHNANLDAKFSYLTSWGTTTAGVTLQDAYITSNTLGKHNRLTFNYFAQQSLHIGQVSATILAGGTYNNSFGSDWAVSADINWRPARHWQVYANASRALRLPTFTDLYYRSKTQVADPNLRPEHAVKAEIGGRLDKDAWSASVSAFYRYGTDIIDWVKPREEEDGPWYSKQLTDLHAAGCNLTFAYAPQKPLAGFLKQVRASYAYTYMSKQSGEWLSKYALDYLRHHASLTLEHVIWRGLGACWQLSVRDRNGSYIDRDGQVTDYKTVLLLDGQIYYEHKWEGHKWLRAEVGCTNMTNRQYYDIGGVPQPKHQVTAAVKFGL